ncbi:winged helix family two component transcriptional regulator [gut metagenome]|uniref:Winged helix family two component transcriptional regulator n=1 Tax=gut metagenome TaxID=749906 RepID=J9G8X0_9ZZZZ
MSIKILVVDDNTDILSNLRDYLEMCGYAVETAGTATAAYERLGRTQDIDLLVLDIGLPDFDGFKLCRLIREENRRLPVLMLTARDSVDDRVKGLRTGADDYLVKPFALKELAARIEALLRRRFGGKSRELAIGDLLFDLETQRVTRAGRELKLNPTGLRLLRVLMTRSPAIVTREELEEALWSGHTPSSDSLRSNLYLLRQAVDKPFPKALIHTHAGLGWSIRESD